MKFKKNGALLIAIVLLLLINVTQLKAQGVPCGDPDLDCPVDGPVMFLVAAVLLLSVKKMTEAKRVLNNKLKCV